MSTTIAHEPLRVARLHPDAKLPRRAHTTDAGLDLYTVEAHEFTGRIGERAQLDTGVAVEIPDGWVGLVCPRSGLAAQHGIGLTNAPGVVDAGYRGSIRVLLTATDSSPLHVHVGDRIAQLVLVPCSTAPVLEVDELSSADRGSDGFGSTGRAG